MSHSADITMAHSQLLLVGIGALFGLGAAAGFGPAPTHAAAVPVLVVGAGGCDVSDTECEPMSATAEQSVSMFDPADLSRCAVSSSVDDDDDTR